MSLFVISFVLLLGVHVVSAGIYFSEFDTKYNLGDMIDINVNVDPIVEGRLLKVTLFCNENNVIEFNNLPDESGNVNIKLPLNFYTIKEANGDCYFLGDYFTELRTSLDFEISKLLIIKLSKESFFASPGEEIIISGSAEKLSGNVVDGEVEINIPLLGLYESNSGEGEVENEEEIDGPESDEDGNNQESGNESSDAEDTNEETEEEVEEVEEVDEVVESFNAGKFYGKVVSGEFSVNIRLSEETPAGNYRVDILVYEESDGQRSSEGIVLANLEVFQILTSIDIALSGQNFDPGTTLDLKSSLLDQTGVNIDDEVSVVIMNENDERIFEKIVNSQETISYQLLSNSSSGYYEIDVSNGDISNNKKFFINEKAIVSFEIINNSLVVTNIGNIPYKKGIEVVLNGKPFVKKINLGLGESREFKLTGSNEEYNIKVSDGETEISRSSVMLTGHAVSVNAVNEKGKGSGSPIVWIFVILILGIGLLFLFRNVFKKKSFAFHKKDKGGFFKFGKGKKDQAGKTEINVGDSGGAVAEGAGAAVGTVVASSVVGDKKKPIAHNQASQVLVLKGHKSNAVVLVLKIKNKIGNVEKQSLEEAIGHAYNKKGAVYEQGDFIFIVFSPLMTRNNKNEAGAAKVGENIVNVLNEHNKKMKDKIDFGIGISSGEIINKIENKKLKFTALGNFIVVAKRLAEASDKQVLVTKEAYERGISEIKAEKRKLNEGEVYEVRSVIDGEKNKKFLRGFLARQKKEAAK